MLAGVYSRFQKVFTSFQTTLFVTLFYNKT